MKDPQLIQQMRTRVHAFMKLMHREKIPFILKLIIVFALVSSSLVLLS